MPSVSNIANAPSRCEDSFWRDRGAEKAHVDGMLWAVVFAGSQQLRDLVKSHPTFRHRIGLHLNSTLAILGIIGLAHACYWCLQCLIGVNFALTVRQLLELVKAIWTELQFRFETGQELNIESSDNTG